MSSPIDLPMSITSEIVKNCIDSDVILSKTTKSAFSRIGGVFILYISHLANEICKSKGRSKITLNDIYEALERAGFQDFNPKIEKALNEYENQTSINQSNNINSGNKKDYKLNSQEYKQN